MTISSITLKVALEIGCAEIFNQIEKFSKEAHENNYTSFTHYNFFYTYPQCEFHQVNTKCHWCGEMPERNYAGIGTINILNNGICNDLIISKKQYIKNTPRLSQMILLCDKHVGSYYKWSPNNQKKKELLQLTLF
jgi:hypothetical protein